MKQTNPEIWKPVVGFEAFYDVSNLGNVRRSKFATRARAKSMSPSIAGSTGRGGRYFQVSLHTSPTNGKRERFFRYVHRIVAEAFIGPCPSGKVVNHKDGNKLNNKIENLEYVTYRENNLHAVENGLHLIRGEQNPMSKVTEKVVKDIRLDYDFFGIGPKALAEKYGLSKKGIEHIVYRTRWKHI